MHINILNSDFEKIAIIDTFESLICCKRYNDIGALDLQIEATIETLSVLKKGNYITRDDDETVYRIEAIELNTNENADNNLLIGAYDIKKILNQRIVYNTEKYDDTVENVIRGLITNNIIEPAIQERKIENFELKDIKGFTEKIKTQISFDNIGEKISKLCKTYDYGYKIFLEDGKIYFDIFKGVNRTFTQIENSQVIFSSGFDNLISSKYSVDISEVKNVALIVGEGEGNQRKKVELGEEKGLDRFEMFVDADDISTEEGTIDDVYENMLLEKGKEEIADMSSKISFEGIVDTSIYEYKKDFDLGDIVIIENEYGIRINARINEIIETWDESGYTLEPKFEYLGIETYLTDENGNILTTENGDNILKE